MITAKEASEYTAARKRCIVHTAITDAIEKGHNQVEINFYDYVIADELKKLGYRILYKSNDNEITDMIIVW